MANTRNITVAIPLQLLFAIADRGMCHTRSPFVSQQTTAARISCPNVAEYQAIFWLVSYRPTAARPVCAPEQAQRTQLRRCTVFQSVDNTLISMQQPDGSNSGTQSAASVLASKTPRSVDDNTGGRRRTATYIFQK